MLGLTRPALIWPDPTRPDPTWPNPTRPDLTWPDPTWYDLTRPDSTRPDLLLDRSCQTPANVGSSEGSLSGCLDVQRVLVHLGPAHRVKLKFYPIHIFVEIRHHAIQELKSANVFSLQKRFFLSKKEMKKSFKCNHYKFCFRQKFLVRSFTDYDDFLITCLKFKCSHKLAQKHVKLLKKIENWNKNEGKILMFIPDSLFHTLRPFEYYWRNEFQTFWWIGSRVRRDHWC